MKVCVVGTGSMGTRHIKNLRDIFTERDEKLIVDVLRSSGSVLDENLAKMINKQLFSLDEIDTSYDAVFIANPTSLHYETMKALQPYTECFFVEKPIFDDAKAAPKIEKEFAGKTIYVACPLRYMLIMSELKKIVSSERVLSVRAISSSYLPNWRPQSDYRRSYSARKDLGGGVEIDLIHEWDYLIDLFGYPKTVYSVLAKNSSLEIETNDSADYLAGYDDMTVSLHLDYFGRVTQRSIELITESDTIVADLVKGKITWLLSGKSLECTEQRDDYQKRELRNFLEIINGNKPNTNDLQRAINTLRITKGIN